MSAIRSETVWQSAVDHKRKPGIWWEGRRVRLVRTVRTRGGIVYNKGRVAKVTRKFGGLCLEGRQLLVWRVPYFKLEVDVTDLNKQTKTK